MLRRWARRQRGRRDNTGRPVLSAEQGVITISAEMVQAPIPVSGRLESDREREVESAVFLSGRPVLDTAPVLARRSRRPFSVVVAEGPTSVVLADDVPTAYHPLRRHKMLVGRRWKTVTRKGGPVLMVAFPHRWVKRPPVVAPRRPLTSQRPAPPVSFNQRQFPPPRCNRHTFFDEDGEKVDLAKDLQLSDTEDEMDSPQNVSSYPPGLEPWTRKWRQGSRLCSSGSRVTCQLSGCLATVEDLEDHLSRDHRLVPGSRHFVIARNVATCPR